MKEVADELSERIEDNELDGYALLAFADHGVQLVAEPYADEERWWSEIKRCAEERLEQLDAGSEFRVDGELR